MWSCGSNWILKPAESVAVEVRVAGDTALVVRGTTPDIIERASVDSGAVLDLTLYSFGSSTCVRAGPTTVTSTDNTLVVDLVDSVASGGDVLCTDDPAPHERSVVHTFVGLGEKVIRVRGANTEVRVVLEVM
jgi:hypothetical protein